MSKGYLDGMAVACWFDCTVRIQPRHWATSCVRALAQTRPCIEQHIKELPGVQSECVTMDISMAMTLSVDSPTLPRLQYLSE